MKAKVLTISALTALCCSISCSGNTPCSSWTSAGATACATYTDPTSGAACIWTAAGACAAPGTACNTYTDSTSCAAGKDSASGAACSWFNNACGVPSSASDPVPQTVTCAEITTTQATCNAHAVAGTRCYWLSSGSCISAKSCAVLDQVGCTVQGLVAGNCQWSGGACIADTSKCNFNGNACSQYTAWKNNSGACNAVTVNGVQVCRWSGGALLGGTCSNNWATAGTDPCNAAGSQTTCASTEYSGACSWN